MGLILESNVLIAAECRGDAVAQAIPAVALRFGDQKTAISAISVIGLTHGIYRADSSLRQEQRRIFVEEICRELPVYPLTLEIAQLAGRMEGEQAAEGIAIPFEDLIIGATAMDLGFDVVTLNV